MASAWSELRSPRKCFGKTRTCPGGPDSSGAMAKPGWSNGVEMCRITLENLKNWPKPSKAQGFGCVARWVSVDFSCYVMCVCSTFLLGGRSLQKCSCAVALAGWHLIIWALQIGSSECHGYVWECVLEIWLVTQKVGLGPDKWQSPWRDPLATWGGKSRVNICP